VSKPRIQAASTSPHGTVIGTQWNIGPGATVVHTDADGTTLVHNVPAAEPEPPAYEVEITVNRPAAIGGETQ
jgi:hypothetical protein